MMTEYEISDPENSMRMDFEFRDVEACAELWKKVCDECDRRGIDVEEDENVSSA